MENIRLANGNFQSVDRIWAFIAIHPNGGGEGIMGCNFPIGGGINTVAMVGAGEPNIEIMKPIADWIRENEGIQYEIRYFVRENK